MKLIIKARNKKKKTKFTFLDIVLRVETDKTIR